jgi:hypothetical protein
MLYAYFDASRTQPSGVTSIGGYIGSKKAWEEVDLDWRDTLKMFGLTRFHLTDLLAGRTHLGREKGELAVVTFATIIAASQLSTFAATVRDADLPSNWNAGFESTFPEPYHLCFRNLMNEMAIHIPLNFAGEEVEIICDMDTGDLAAAQAIFEQVRTDKCDRLVSLTFGLTDQHPRLQCADLFVGKERLSYLAGGPFEVAQDYLDRVRMKAGGRSGFGSYWSQETQRRVEALFAELREKEREGGATRST